MSIALLLPRFDYPALEERFANWQSELILRGSGHGVHFHDADESAAEASAGIDDEFVLVATDPFVLASPHIGERLQRVLEASEADAAIPVSNESKNPRQISPPDVPYMTLRELEILIERWQSRTSDVVRVSWDRSDPALFVCRTSLLDSVRAPLALALEGRSVAVSSGDYVHRWSSMRGQCRTDLLERIDSNAKSILEVGCGEGALGQALKQRQKCRVVGVEVDAGAAAIARRRLDDVYCGDARDVITIVDEKFDWVIGSEIVEHVDDPWSFLADLRRRCRSGGRLLLSLPNAANGSVVADLLAGRFDYVYIGITCVGHLRFFTRQSIEEMLRIAGWTDVSLESQRLPVTPQAAELMERFRHSGVPFSEDDLLASGYYVTARNR